MKNCLVTKLKEVVNNDNLQYLGSIILRAEAEASFTAANRKISIGSQTSVTFEITSVNGYFTDSQGNRISDSVAGFSNNGRKFIYTRYVTQTDVYLSNHNIQVKVTSKYALDSLRIGSKISCALNQMSYAGFNDGFFSFVYKGSDKKESIEVLKYVPIDTFAALNSNNPLLYGDVSNLTLYNGNTGSNFNIKDSACTGILSIPAGRYGQISVRNTQVIIDIDTMPVTNLTLLDARQAPNVRGNCEALLNKVNKAGLTELYLFGTQCTGRVDEMLKSLYGVTRTAERLSINMSSNMTFNSIYVANVLSITFDGSDMVVTNTLTHAELGRYNGTTWTYSS